MSIILNNFSVLSFETTPSVSPVGTRSGEVNTVSTAADQDRRKPSSFESRRKRKKLVKKKKVSRIRGWGGVAQLLTYKKKKKKEKENKRWQLYFRTEQTFIAQQRIYFERYKFNKYISTVIAQILLRIVEPKTHLMQYKKNKTKVYIGKTVKLNGLTRRWTETNTSCTFQKHFFFYWITNMVSEFKVLFTFSFLSFQISCVRISVSLIQFSFLFFSIYLASNFWCYAFSQADIIFFSHPVAVCFFWGL